MKYIKGFDSLRAFSIIFVIITHLGLYTLLPDSDFIRDRLWKLFSGTTGVQIFFTLSGFLITTILFAEKERNGRINFKNFYIRRFIRLLPPLIVFYIIMGFLMSFGYLNTNIIGFLFSFFYVYNFIPNRFYTGEIGHTWSLAVEEQFYLTWPFIVNFVKRKFSFSIIIFITLILCIIAYYVFPKIDALKSFKHYRWFIPAIAPIMVGSYFSVLYKFNMIRPALLEKKQYLILLAILLFIFPLYTPMALMEIAPIFQASGISMFLIWIIYSQDSKFVALLDNKLLSYIGKISYGLYVYQGIFLRTSPGGKLAIQEFPLNICLTVAVALLSYELLEKPILKLKKKFK